MGEDDTRLYAPGEEGHGEPVSRIKEAEQLSEEEMKQIEQAENQLEKMVEEEQRSLELKEDAIGDLKKAYAHFKKIEQELQHLDKVHDYMHSRGGLSREDLSEEELDTWNKVIREGDDIQKQLEGVLQLLQDAEGDIKKLEKIEKKEEEQTKQEDQSLQQQIQAVENVLTAVQDIRKLDREQA